MECLYLLNTVITCCTHSYCDLLHAVINSFLLLATENFIHYLPVPDNDGARGDIRTLPVVPDGQLADMAYDPINYNVVWVENNSSILHRWVRNASFV